MKTKIIFIKPSAGKDVVKVAFSYFVDDTL